MSSKGWGSRHLCKHVRDWEMVVIFTTRGGNESLLPHGQKKMLTIILVGVVRSTHWMTLLRDTSINDNDTLFRDTSINDNDTLFSVTPLLMTMSHFSVLPLSMTMKLLPDTSINHNNTLPRDTSINDNDTSPRHLYKWQWHTLWVSGDILILLLILFF